MSSKKVSESPGQWMATLGILDCKTHATGKWNGMGEATYNGVVVLHHWQKLCKGPILPVQLLFLS